MGFNVNWKIKCFLLVTDLGFTLFVKFTTALIMARCWKKTQCSVNYRIKTILRNSYSNVACSAKGKSVLVFTIRMTSAAFIVIMAFFQFTLRNWLSFAYLKIFNLCTFSNQIYEYLTNPVDRFTNWLNGQKIFD